MATENLKQHKLGWIGIGRMGYAMAARLAKVGCDLSVWNRTKSKAEPLKEYGAKVVDNLTDLAGCDIIFTMVSTGDDVKEVLYGPNGVMSKGGKPKLVIDSTSISLEASAEIRAELAAHGVQMLAAPVSGNAKVIKAGPDYLYAQYTTKWMRFVDDAEFWFDPAAQRVQVRSASRLGHGDLGVNRARIEALRQRLSSP